MGRTRPDRNGSSIRERDCVVLVDLQQEEVDMFVQTIHPYPDGSHVLQVMLKTYRELGNSNIYYAYHRRRNTLLQCSVEKVSLVVWTR